MAAELPRPGVEVIQVFRSVSPTVITPTLVPCVVGVCKQIVDVSTTTASGGSAINSQALVPLQASFVAKEADGSPPRYEGLEGLSLVMSLNNGPPLTITFSGDSLSVSQVVNEVNAALSLESVTSFVAETLGARASATQWRLRSTAADEFQTIQILAGTDPSVAAAFGISVSRTFAGASYYSQDQLSVNTASFPDPNNNLSEIVIDPDTVRAFLYMGQGVSLQELKKDRTFLTSGSSVAASISGSVNLTTLTYGASGTIDGSTLIISLNGGPDLTVTFSAPANLAAALAQINAVIGSVATATLTPTTNHLVLTTIAKGKAASMTIGAGTANDDLGLPAGSAIGIPAVASIDQGNGTAVTPLIQLTGANLTASETNAVVHGTTTLAGVTDGNTLILDDGTGVQTLTFNGASTSTLVLARINGLFGASAGGQLTATTQSGNLLLTNDLVGTESMIRIVGGTALTELGVVAGTTRGNAFPAMAGDELNISGQYYATITQVNVGGQSNVVKINRQIAINDNIGDAWYITARGITDTNAQVSRPSPDLTIDGHGNLTIKRDLLRDLAGNALNPSVARAQLYVSYHAVRQDVSAVAKHPALLRFSDTTTLGNQLAPISAANPLALGAYFALLNAPGTQVTGLGVDAVDAGAPYGTVESFARAATFLEAYEVYAIAPLTHDTSVGQLFNTHVGVMSSAENKGERIVLFNPSMPTHAPDTLIASGLNGNSLPTQNYFDSGIPNLDALLAANGVDSAASLTVDQGVFLDVGDGNHYAISHVVGSQVIVKTSGFASGENDDAFYESTSPISGTMIATPFAVRVRGAALELVDGTPDKDGIAMAYAALAQGFQSRRFWQVIPDKAAATLGGLEQIIEGFYLCAAVAGMVGQQPPQQSFTNFPMSGFTRVIGSNGYLTERQLNVCAGGGNYVIVQDSDGAPLTARMALTSDLTSIETRTDSITKVVDFSAKFLRRGLKNFIGRFNITQGFLDSLGHVIQGLLGFLADAGTLIGSTLNNIVQDTSAPDTVLVDITLDVPFPCNYIRLTLVI